MAGRSVWMRPEREAADALVVVDTEVAVEEAEGADTSVEAEEEVGPEDDYNSLWWDMTHFVPEHYCPHVTPLVFSLRWRPWLWWW